MNLKNRSGFTLLEVIIVIIIVGVLASLALPRFFSTVEYSRATEAMQAIATVRQSMERCYLMRVSYTGPCSTFGNLDVEDPNGSPNSHFNYTMTGAATTYTIIATRNTRDGGEGTGTIWLSLQAVAGLTAIIKGGTGPFGAVQ